MAKIRSLQDWIHEKLIKSNESETCVLCGKELIISKYTPIEQRRCYIEGCGQLCTNCFVKLYSSK